VTPDYIICLEDGRPFKMMKRWLRATYGMTPEQYRAKWNLPADYPMVAPNYARSKSAYAKTQGLGTTRLRRRAEKRRTQRAAI
jgi:predicted transcriptional regulator